MLLQCSTVNKKSTIVFAPPANQTAGSIVLADGISSGSFGSVSAEKHLAANPSTEISTLTITLRENIPVSAKEVAIFGCNSQILANQYTDTSFIGVDPGPSGGISFWLGGYSASAFLKAGGGQAGVDAANAMVLRSQDPQDAGTDIQLNPPQPKPQQPPEEDELEVPEFVP